VLLDYLSADEEMKVMQDNTSRVDPPEVFARTTADEILKFQWLVRQVPMSTDVARKAVDLVRATRPGDPSAPAQVKQYVRHGASVRATQFLALAAKARALMEGRFHVIDSDLRSLAPSVLRHRVLTNYQAESDGLNVDAILRHALDAVIPA
jgi:MoxR-like ATPase